jgi:hypothetical protein
MQTSQKTNVDTTQELVSTLEAQLSSLKETVKTTASEIERLKANGALFTELTEAISKHQAAVFLVEGCKRDLEQAREALAVAGKQAQDDLLLLRLRARVASAEGFYAVRQKVQAEARAALMEAMRLLQEVGEHSQAFEAEVFAFHGLLSYPLTKAQGEATLTALRNSGEDLGLVINLAPRYETDELPQPILTGSYPQERRLLQNIAHIMTTKVKGAR